MKFEQKNKEVDKLKEEIKKKDKGHEDRIGQLNNNIKMLSEQA